MGVLVGGTTAVFVGVAVGVSVGMSVGVSVGGTSVGTGVLVGTAVSVGGGVSVGRGVLVNVGVAVGVLVGVNVGNTPTERKVASVKAQHKNKPVQATSIEPHPHKTLPLVDPALRRADHHEKNLLTNATIVNSPLTTVVNKIMMGQIEQRRHI